VLVCGLIAFFALSGFIANHAEWFESEDKNRTLHQEHLRLPAVDAKDRKAVIAAVVARHGGELNDKSIDEEEGKLSFESESVWSTRSFSVDRENGFYSLDERPAQWSRVISDLHRGKHAGLVQKIVMDVAALSLVLVTGTGIALGLQVRHRRRTATALILISSTSLIYLLMQR
jgi:hypothetical protein